MNIGLDSQQFIIDSDAHHLVGKSRSIRSDEWLVHTPMSIAQWSHSPRFPIINENIGPDGHNMLIVGMLGTPVQHISTLAKPATWGYFLFDLRRALAWHWWFPVFGAFLAFWKLTKILIPGNAWIPPITAGIFITSGYVTAWSNWPAYTVFFPATAICISWAMLRVHNNLIKILLSLVLGVVVTGYVLILYPAWQVTTGYLFLFLFLAIIVRDRIVDNLQLIDAMAFMLSIGVTVFFLVVWLNDAHEAIIAMQETVYPGQRAAVNGGGMSEWQFFRGFLNNHTLYYPNAIGSNQSESSSFLYFFPLIIAAYVIMLKDKRIPSPPALVLMIFCVIAVIYQFLGFPNKIITWSLWGYTLPKRTDLALGTASILLSSIWIAERPFVKPFSKIITTLLALIWASIVISALLQTPLQVTGSLHPFIYVIIAVIVGGLGAALIRGLGVAFLTGVLVINLAMTLPFNPLIITPSNIESRLGERAPISSSMSRIIYIGGSQAMWLAAAGIPIYNGVFFYPQKTVSEVFDPNGKYVDKINRYQHLHFVPHESSLHKSVIVESPQADVVRIIFDKEEFDFGLVDPGLVVSSMNCDLSGNPSLEEVFVDENMQILKITH